MIADFLPHQNPSREHCQLIDCTDISVIPDVQSSDSLPGKGEVRKLRLHCLMRAGDSNARRLLQLESPEGLRCFVLQACLRAGWKQWVEGWGRGEREELRGRM